jgi:hypothetical protein
MPLARKTNKKFTYTDYVTWPDDERWELIDGVAYNITPTPTVTHQKIQHIQRREQNALLAFPLPM